MTVLHHRHLLLPLLLTPHSWAFYSTAKYQVHHERNTSNTLSQEIFCHILKIHTIMNYTLWKMVFSTTYSLILLSFLIRYLMDYFCLCKICTRYLTKINYQAFWGNKFTAVHVCNTLCHHFLNTTNNSMHCLHSLFGERIISSGLWLPVQHIWMLELYYFWGKCVCQ
jgi:hypothetical protein